MQKWCSPIVNSFKAVAFLTLWLSSESLYVPRMRKGAVQIRFEILEFLYYHSSKPQLRTYVWRKATSLSYDDFLKHLSYLKDKDLIVETEGNSCKITDKGKKVYEDLQNALKSIL